MRVVVKERERQREGREWRDERGNGKREKRGGEENVANGKRRVMRVGLVVRSGIYVGLVAVTLPSGLNCPTMNFHTKLLPERFNFITGVRYGRVRRTGQSDPFTTLVKMCITRV